MSKQSNMTLTSHILELRSRFIRIIIAVLITTGLSALLAKYIFEVLKQPAGDTFFIFTEVTGMVGIYIKVCLVSGIILAMPYITYQFIMFVSPALTNREKSYVYSAVPFITAMFLGGVAFAYFVILPPAINFLIRFGNDIAVPQIRIDNYISLIARLLFAVGLVFEMPVVTSLLARIGVISSRWLASKRKVAIVIAFIAGAIITPTFDPVNQTLVAVPIIALYELSIWLAKVVEKAKVTEASKPI